MDPADGSTVWALVLAGGDGTRLQALTRQLTGAPVPKQYCRIAGDRSLLEATLARIRPFVPLSRTATIVTADHLAFARDQLGELPPENVLVQPHNRDTGPGLLFSLLRLARRQPTAIVAVLPSDHYIRDDAAFLDHLARAAGLVRRFPRKIVLLGMTPDRPDPGLGYVERGAPIGGAEGTDACHVAAFVEKPTRDTAADIILRGGLWNSFVMVFRLDAMLALLRRQQPDDYRELHQRDVTAYGSLAPWNFSRDFLARVPDELAVLRVGDIGWSDWGTPEAIERTFLAMNRVPPWHVAADTPQTAANGTVPGGH
jgi:mannose-1-phosphate guanylyltransferase